MNEVVEKVARAIAESDDWLPDEVNWLHWQKEARAAISALLDAVSEPSEAMVEYSARTLWESDRHKWVAPDFSQHESYLRGISKEAYRAMIAALRSEVEGEWSA